MNFEKNSKITILKELERNVKRNFTNNFQEEL